MWSLGDQKLRPWFAEEVTSWPSLVSLPGFLTEEGLASSRDNMLLEMERQTLNSSDWPRTYQLGGNAFSLPLNMTPTFVAWCREE